MSELVYPKTHEMGGEAFTFRTPEPGDSAGILAFARGLPEGDLLYLRRDITEPKVVEAWMRDIEEGNIRSLLAVRGETIVGTSALVLDPLSWSRHVGEIRVLVDEQVRGKGIGRQLIEETFLQALDSGLDKIMAKMTLDQKAAMGVFEEMGFSGEALLKDHVRDRNGEDHDILILSCKIRDVLARMQAVR